ncbi:MAG: selenide, water dikinase SelD [Planctomycetota bacterium]|nr:selenide, water dikinase SelD [Planctomycetota bacterium]
MPQGELAQVLRGVTDVANERLLVGPMTLDDAGVVVLGEAEGLPAGHELPLIQTVDFFPPVVDDPYYYGAIAAANSISDIYAMGGRPITALCLAGFPCGFDREWMGAIFKGGYEKVKEAGAILAGGHTVESEVQFGFSVTGVVERRLLTTNAGARPGDVCYLTKSLGMGTMTTAAKFGKITWEQLEPAARQMATLNAAAAQAMNAVGAIAATDITGFGLVGHGMNIARSSELCLELDTPSIPIFPGAYELAKKGNLSGGAKKGKVNIGAEVDSSSAVDATLELLLFDAETSGGLMIVVDEASAPKLEDELAARDLPVHRIGRFVEKTSGHHVRLLG